MKIITDFGWEGSPIQIKVTNINHKNTQMIFKSTEMSWKFFLFVSVGLCAGWAASQFLNHRPFPTYSLENMPDTEFSCREKVLGGYYADPDTQCQMFHICVKVAGVGVSNNHVTLFEFIPTR